MKKIKVHFECDSTDEDLIFKIDETKDIDKQIQKRFKAWLNENTSSEWEIIESDESKIRRNVNDNVDDDCEDTKYEDDDKEDDAFEKCLETANSNLRNFKNEYCSRLFNDTLFKCYVNDLEIWLEGNLIISNGRSFISAFDNFEYNDEGELIFDNNLLVPIETEYDSRIGQFTGKLDVKNNKIFADIDIFEFHQHEKNIHGIGYFEFNESTLKYNINWYKRYVDSEWYDDDYSIMEEEVIEYIPTVTEIGKIVGNTMLSEREIGELIF